MAAAAASNCHMEGQRVHMAALTAVVVSSHMREQVEGEQVEEGGNARVLAWQVHLVEAQVAQERVAMLEGSEELHLTCHSYRYRELV